MHTMTNHFFFWVTGEKDKFQKAERHNLAARLTSELCSAPRKDIFSVLLKAGKLDFFLSCCCFFPS